MERIISKEPSYRMERVPTGTVDKIIYRAIDGKEFSNEQQCKNHESKITAIEKGKPFFKALDLNNEQATGIGSLVFDANDASSFGYQIWTASTDKDKIEIAGDYLRAIGCENVYLGTLNLFNEGDKVLVCSWIEDEYSDYPTSYTKAIKYEDAIERLDSALNELKQALR